MVNSLALEVEDGSSSFAINCDGVVVGGDRGLVYFIVLNKDRYTGSKGLSGCNCYPRTCFVCKIMYGNTIIGISYCNLYPAKMLIAINFKLNTYIFCFTVKETIWIRKSTPPATPTLNLKGIPSLVPQLEIAVLSITLPKFNAATKLYTP